MAMPGDISGHRKVGRGGITGIQWGEARNAANNAQDSPTAQNYPAQNATGATVEKAWFLLKAQCS